MHKPVAEVREVLPTRSMRGSFRVILVTLGESELVHSDLGTWWSVQEAHEHAQMINEAIAWTGKYA